MSSAKPVPLTCHGHSRPVPHLSFSSINDDDEYYILSSCKDNNPMFRTGATGDWVGTFLGHKGAVWQGRLSGDGGYAATASADFTAKLWDTYTGVCLNTYIHEHVVRAVALPQQKPLSLLATGGNERKLRVFDIQRTSGSTGDSSSPSNVDGGTGSTNVHAYELGPGLHEGTIKSIVWGPDYHTVMTASEDKVLRWFDLRARHIITAVTLEGELGTCELNQEVRVSNPRKSLISVAAGKNVYFFDGRNPGQLVKKFPTSYEVASVAVSIDAHKFVVGGSKDTWVREYSFDDGKELAVHKGHHGPVWSTNFSPDGKLFATGSEDGTVKLWKFCDEPYGLWK